MSCFSQGGKPWPFISVVFIKLEEKAARSSSMSNKSLLRGEKPPYIEKMGAHICPILLHIHKTSSSSIHCILGYFTDRVLPLGVVMKVNLCGVESLLAGKSPYTNIYGCCRRARLEPWRTLRGRPDERSEKRAAKLSR